MRKILYIIHAAGDLRLLNRHGSLGVLSGRLEIYLNGQWGTVCDNGFDFIEADIACSELGYRYANRFGSVSSLG